MRSWRFNIDSRTGVVVALLSLVFALLMGQSFLADAESRPLGPERKVTISPLDAGTAEFERRFVDGSLPPVDTGASGRQATVREEPVRFEVALDPIAREHGPTVMEIANLRARRFRVWLLSPLPDGLPGGESATELKAAALKRGLAVQLPAGLGAGRGRIVGIADPQRIARVTATLWTADAFQESSTLFERQGSALFGAFLLMSLFSAVLSALNRDFAFLVFAGWLVTTLRLVGSLGGWDTEWLGLGFSAAASNAVVRAGLAAQALLTILLFRTLFMQDRSSRVGRLLAALTYACVLMLAASPFVESSRFLPAYWALAGVGMVTLAIQVVRSLIVAPSSVGAWYAFSWICFFSGPLTEIALSAGLIRSAPAWINMQTCGLAAALLVAVSLAERMRLERSSRIKAQSEAIENARALTEHYRSMPIGLLSLDRSGTIRTFNPALAEMFGLRSPDALGPGAHLRLADLPIGPDLAAHIERLRRGEASMLRDLRLESRDGSWFQVDLTQRGDLVEGAIQDVSARAKAEATIARMVDHDVLTEALNQRGLNDAVARALALVAKGIPCAMLDIDIDRFKTLNDLYGHMVGDEVLAKFGKRIAARIPRDDALARLGDSFKIVLYDCDGARALALANQLHAEVSGRSFDVGNRVLSLSGSIGVLSLDASMSVADAIASTSHACADAKAAGRNRIVQVAGQDRALHGYLEELRVQASLKDRLESQRFFLEMQPIVSLRSAFERLNYEVLVRMRGEDGSIVPPGKFIPAAERNGQMSLIDRWVLTRTLQWLGDNPQHAARLDYATINMSGASLNDARFVDNAFAIMSEFPKLTNKLCFEITETVALTDRSAMARFSERVHSMGGRIALDDFGAGYTSFTYLREIAADIIKIDGSFVRDIDRNPANHAITRMISDLAHQLGKTCVAEWAEEPATIATLIELGVDFGQGYALGRPMDPMRLCHAESCGELIPDAALRRMLRDGGDLTPDASRRNGADAARATAAGGIVTPGHPGWRGASG
ncbi:MAG: putative bifunctional diguanylate cyclase/phosphodiesterase [Lautropia sp.]